MKVLPFKIPKPKNDFLIIQEDKQWVFYDKLHQHQEVQLSYIVSGTGTLIVGDTVNRFTEGDVIVLGTNLPHVFQSDIPATKSSYMLSVFFNETIFWEKFFEIEEIKNLRSFFNRSNSGFKVLHPTKALRETFAKILNTSKLERFALFFELLQKLHSSRKEELSTFQINKRFSDVEGKRMGVIFDYIIQNFQQEITLEQIAKEASLTKTAFCRFFKTRTNKTFYQFLIELRLEHACRLLRQESKELITDIAFQSGFTSVSNFNRYFKKVKGMSPLEYRKLN